ncbi:MAG: M1 family metallopeptidase [Candidatus Lokiarchaeota archaeon]|nr:M1 family metallopeptidase [Candidatus Lokiarchaeota archaeon]
MKKNRIMILGLLVSIFLVNCVASSNLFITSKIPQKRDNLNIDQKNSDSINFNPKLAQLSGNFSNYNLSLIMDETNSMVEGNLTVDFYNNDNVNFTRIPFHIYLSGMAYYTRQGRIDIINVTDVNDPNISFPFEVYPTSQIMWVNLSDTLEPHKRAQFKIQFNATIPDGSKLPVELLDRANSYGNDGDQSRIYKFASFYPIPSVYDNKDGWNIDSYLTTGDPFYFDMAYYNFFIEAPTGMIIAATGNLDEKLDKGETTRYHFNPVYPVREVTFAASRYFQVQSKISNGVNLSTYFLPKDAYLWNNYALNHAEDALILFNASFGTYPYPTLNIVEEYTSFGGMEYPNQVYISEVFGNRGNPLYVANWFLEKVIAHEVCHQWWYNLVGNDEVDVGFLDEGLACWSTDYYGEHYYGDWEYFQYTLYIDTVRSYYALNGLSSKINQTVYECLATDTDYWYVAYTKAPLIFEKLRQTIGLSDFLDGLKLYFTRHQFELVLLSDIQRAFEDVVGHSLDWFFFPWFDNSFLPKYSITHNSYNSDTQNLNIRIIDLNEPLNDYNYSQQVPLHVYDASNSLIFSQTVWINGTTELSFSLSTRPRKVSLIYSNYVLVQLTDYFDLTLDSFIPFESGWIPGYEMASFLVISIVLIGFVLYDHRRKIKIKR